MNWGPPSLSFSSGMAGLSDALPRFTRNQTNAAGGEGFINRGRHNFTIGGDIRRHHVDILSQQDPRGGFTFTGSATRLRLRRLPAGHSEHEPDRLRQRRQVFQRLLLRRVHHRRLAGWSFADDHRWCALGVRVAAQRAVRIDWSTSISRRASARSVRSWRRARPGRITGETFPSSLMRPDWGGLQPRLAVAWRPVPGSSVVVRAGYGIYRNT